MRRCSGKVSEPLPALLDEVFDSVSQTMDDMSITIVRAERWWWRRKKKLDKRFEKLQQRGCKRYSRQRGVRMILLSIFIVWQCFEVGLNSTSCSKTWLESWRMGLAWPAGYYCGPSNGEDFRMKPRDALDATCAQHDFCIENSLYPVSSGGEHEKSFKILFPKGSVDIETGEERCGMPLRAWRRNADWAEQIMKCDQQMVNSIVQGFQCDTSLPQSRFCFDEDLVGLKSCARYKWWSPLFWPCRMTAFGARAFEKGKIRRIARAIHRTLDTPASPNNLRGQNNESTSRPLR